MLDSFWNVALFKECAIFTCFNTKMFIFSNEVNFKILYLNVFRSSYWEKYKMHEKKGCCIEIFIVLISLRYIAVLCSKGKLFTNFRMEN